MALNADTGIGAGKGGTEAGVGSNNAAKAYTSTVVESQMLSANSLVLLDSLPRLKALCFCLFVATQARRFRTIDPLEQTILFNNDRVSTPGIGLSSMPNTIELCKRAMSKSSAAFTY